MGKACKKDRNEKSLSFFVERGFISHRIIRFMPCYGGTKAPPYNIFGRYKPFLLKYNTDKSAAALVDDAFEGLGKLDA